MRPAQTALWLRLVVALGLALVGPLLVGWSSARAPIYVSSWAVRVSQGYREAERLARKFGFVNLGQIFPDGQYYHLRHRGVVQQSLTPHWGHRLRLRKDPKVQWFEQQTLQRRVKRSLVVPTDPWFSKQWYMNNKVQPDLNILQVWSQGLSGQGIVVSVLDDGIEKDHPDLWANYDPLASYDFNDYDPDPQPRYTPSDENRAAPRHPFTHSLVFQAGQVTTDLHHQCTDKHTGTSASAPLAAGMIALALEANPFLTWRDMQHLVVRASRPAQLQAEDWRTNGVGRQVSHHYGYGLLDARLLVDTARTWLPTRPQQKCAIRIVHTATPILPLMQVRKNVSACAGRASYIRSLEHVQVRLSLSYSRRGDLEISLTSPMGTRSTLVAIRPLDVSGQGYNNWIFMSTHFWDEDPQGLWTLGLENKGYYFNTGTLYRYTLLLYGTAEDMSARPPGPQVTSSACVQWDTEGLCQECHGPAYILGHLCLSYCPPRYFSHTRQAVTAGPGRSATPALRVCSSCHPSCYTCRGGSPLNCTTCPPAYTLDEHRGSCSGPAPPNSTPGPTAVAHPSCHHGRAQAVVLALLAMAFGSPFLCSVLSVGCLPPCGGLPHHHPGSGCWREPRDI
ncbi:proprotein convertase subtilisin/kexin type 4 [Neomonachus schauinslandi]|uniref:Proprotein convertase subtilisin/kexin type 4 n=1 Tax=Neomonachus schauinslandi TaxID=29088 RepID=A0A8M1MDK5_NEOSC|nr:proprotein convertase subtilisin/kexin type 4 [Neomonachus schauinslandi]